MALRPLITHVFDMCTCHMGRGHHENTLFSWYFGYWPWWASTLISPMGVQCIFGSPGPIPSRHDQDPPKRCPKSDHFWPLFDPFFDPFFHPQNGPPSESSLKWPILVKNRSKKDPTFGQKWSKNGVKNGSKKGHF